METREEEFIQLQGCEAEVQVIADGGEEVLANVTSAIENVWLRISPEDRQLMGRFWSENRCALGPCLVFNDPWYGDETKLANCEAHGLLLKFDWPTMSHMPADVIQAPIAHEMAHVYQFAIGKSRYDLTDDDLLGIILDINRAGIDEVGRTELHADETMTRWGFDSIQVTAWLFQHFDPETGIRRKKPLTMKYSREEARRFRWIRYHGKFNQRAVTDH